MDNDDITEILRDLIPNKKEVAKISEKSSIEKKIDAAMTVVDDLDKNSGYSADFDFVRKNIKSLIEKGFLAIEDLYEIASESSSARAFEVLGQLMKASLDGNKQLLDIHKDKIEMDGGNKKTTIQGNTNNIMFVGTTKDLAELRKKQLDDE